MAVEDARQDEVGDDAGVADEQQRAADGELGVHRVRRPRVLAEERHRRDARPDVEVHRQLQIAADLPERIPRLVREVGRAEVVGVGGHVDAARTERGNPLRLADAFVDVPGRHQWQWQQPVVRLGLDLGHRVVVDLDREPRDDRIVTGAEPLTSEAERAREDDLRVDAALVEHLETDLGVVRALVDLVDRPLEERVIRALLRAVARDDTAGAEAAHRLAVEHPRALSVDQLHVGNAIAVLGRGAAGEQIGGLGPMRVRIDDQLIV